MPTLDEAARTFLTVRRIAVAGVSRGADSPANAIYRRLRAAGKTAYAVNPVAERVENGEPAFPSLAALPEPVDAVVAVVPEAASVALVRECGTLGIPRLWVHGSFGGGLRSGEARRVAAEAGVELIAGSCPMMYLEPVDPGHRCMRWLRRVTGTCGSVTP